MKQRPRIFYSESQKAQMWDHRQKWDSLGVIARYLIDTTHPSIRRILSDNGGIRPTQRKRVRLALSLAEREEISRTVVAGDSIRSIATSLGRAPSTMSREIRRNGGPSRYRANQTDRVAWERAQRPKTCNLVGIRALVCIVASKLHLEWSPETGIF